MVRIFKISLLLLMAKFIFNPHIAHAQQSYSALWGKDGEKWDKKRIPDFTNAGYREGKSPLPRFKNTVNISSFGAKGDGNTDNTIAFRKAIAACKTNSTLLIPEGVFVISDTIQIGKSGIAIKGMGKGKSTIFIKKGIEELYPKFDPVNNPNNRYQTPWSWSGGIILFTGDIEDVGIENLTIKFPDSLYAGHNFHERAYNAVGFSGKAHNGWVSQVNFIGADISIWIEESAHHITAQHFELEMGPQRDTQRVSGHHAIELYGGHNLVQYFDIKAKYVHDLSVESINSVYNVFHSGKGKDLCIDHHNHEQTNNLFTDLDAGVGSRIFVSGGNSVPRGISFHETYWNIRGEKNMEYCDQFNTMEKQSLNNVMVGIKTLRPSELGNAQGNWFETIDPHSLFPQNLYLAQMKFHKYKIYAN